MKALKQIALFIVGTLVVAGLIVGVVAWDFHLWRLEHPTTPTWVFWAHGGK